MWRSQRRPPALWSPCAPRGGETHAAARKSSQAIRSAAVSNSPWEGPAIDAVEDELLPLEHEQCRNPVMRGAPPRVGPKRANGRARPLDDKLDDVARRTKPRPRNREVRRPSTVQANSVERPGRVRRSRSPARAAGEAPRGRRIPGKDEPRVSRSAFSFLAFNRLQLCQNSPMSRKWVDDGETNRPPVDFFRSCMTKVPI